MPNTLAESLNFQGSDPNYGFQSNVENAIILVPHEEEIRDYFHASQREGEGALHLKPCLKGSASSPGITDEIELQHRYLGISDLISTRKSQSSLTEGSEYLMIQETDINPSKKVLQLNFEHRYLSWYHSIILDFCVVGKPVYSPL